LAGVNKCVSDCFVGMIGTAGGQSPLVSRGKDALFSVLEDRRAWHVVNI